MSTERRRNADGGRRRADGPDDGPRGDGGRRRAGGPPREERAGGRRRPDSEDGLRGDDRPAPRSRRARPPGDEARSEGRPRPEGGRRRAEGERPRRPDGERRRRPEGDGERPRRRPDDPRSRRPEDGDRPRRRPDDPRAGGRRRSEGPRDPRDREHGSRSEGRRSGGRGARAAAASGGRGGRGGGGGRRRPREDEPDDRPWFKRFLSKAWKPALAFCGLMIIAGVAAFAVLYAMAPDPEELEKNAEKDASATQILWAATGDAEKGEVALTTGEVQRVAIQREDIPEEVVDGVLAAEQATFYEDPGINIKGIGRAILSGGDAGGGSTITQQMARNYYSDLDGDPPLTRKIREIFISIKLGQKVPPDEILTTYLNTIYFGRGASGIEMAAQKYFGKSVSELDRAEGAYLGIIIQMPSNFENPEPDSWTANYLDKERWPYVQRQLAAMYENTGGERGLPEAEAQQLEVPDSIIPYEPEADLDDPRQGYIRQAVINEVERRYSERNITGADIATKGLVIQTSLDPDLMTAAEEAFDVLPESAADDTMHGLTAVDPSTGEIVAFNGGPDVSTVINNSLVHQTQAGSAYKPYVLARALADDIGLRSQFNGDSGLEFPGLASPVINSGEVDYGEVDLIQSTADSVNTSYVDLAIKVDPGRVDELAVEMGVHPDRQTTSQVGPLVALGTHQVNALDMASGYATFAAEGRHFPAHMVTQVTTADGEVIDPDDEAELESGTEVISQAVAADATYAMQQAVLEGGAKEAALSDGRPVAGKTGTSSDAVSAWFVGYTPQLSASVGLSRAQGDPLDFGPEIGDVFGGTTSAKVWKAFMEVAMEGQEHQQFPAPQWVGEDQRFLPTPTPSETPEETDEPSDEPSETPSEEECVPGEPGCDVEESPEDCHWMDPDCNNEESPDPDECGSWPLPDCEDDEEPNPGVPPPGSDQSNQANSNNSLIRPRD
ncbi:transglycosylase domain-containing protein [Nocardiopsis sp. NPDC058789]|uniref:transglycosylase domain-containing protein n=1 Tax=Nocardiopsis sp. NPDC058789 TaxID=3346634 RepID=UPI00366BB4EF